MDRSLNERGHIAVVDTWLERSLDHGSSPEVVALFRAAVETLWDRLVTTLGAVTLTAIAERVLATAAGHHAFLSAVNPRPNGDARWRQRLHEHLSQVPRAELIKGLRFGLIELLTVIGRLTAEILSPELHAALLEVSVVTGDARPPIGAYPTANLTSSKVLP